MTNCIEKFTRLGYVQAKKKMLAISPIKANRGMSQELA